LINQLDTLTNILRNCVQNKG